MQSQKKKKIEISNDVIAEIISTIEQNLRSHKKIYISSDDIKRCEEIMPHFFEHSSIKELFSAVINGNLLETLYYLGLCYLTGEGVQEKNNSKAMAFLSTITNADPTTDNQITAMAWYQLGLAYAANIAKNDEKKITEMRKCFQKVIDFGCGDDSFIIIAEQYLRLEKFADAMDCFKQIHEQGNLNGTLGLSSMYLNFHQDKLQGINLLKGIINKEANFYLMSVEKFEEIFYEESKEENQNKQHEYQDAYILVAASIDFENLVEIESNNDNISFFERNILYYNGNPVEIDDIVKLADGLAPYIKNRTPYVRLCREQTENLFTANGPNKKFIAEAYFRLGDIYSKGLDEIKTIENISLPNNDIAEDYYKKASEYGHANAAYCYFLIFIKIHFSQYVNFQKILKSCQTQQKQFIKMKYNPTLYNNNLCDDYEINKDGKIEEYDAETIEKIKEAENRFKNAVKLRHPQAQHQKDYLENFFDRVLRPHQTLTL